MNRNTTIIVLVLVQWNATPLGSLKLNELGDFLAGAVAPLAFLWLVVTVFQQHRELKYNTEALKLQAEELKHQVEETRALVGHAGRQTWRILDKGRNPPGFGNGRRPPLWS